jgi:hypothetical protein
MRGVTMGFYGGSDAVRIGNGTIGFVQRLARHQGVATPADVVLAMPGI